MPKPTQNNGWIALHRKIQDNFLWKKHREFSGAEAWIDILIEVQHSEKPQKVLLGFTVFHCRYGQSLKSITTWAQRWNWSRSKVYRFFQLLKKEEMIETKSEQKTTRLTVCNYNRYDPKRNAGETLAVTDNNVNNVKSRKAEKSFTPPTAKEVNEYAVSIGFSSLDAKYFCEYYSAGDWKLKGGRKMRSWKQTVVTWKKRDSGEFSRNREPELAPLEIGEDGKTPRDRLLAQQEKEGQKKLERKPEYAR